MKGRQSEREFYKEIVHRARRVRERAAESLRRSRERGPQQSEGEGAHRSRRRPEPRRQD
jgi:hypothetical protein